MENGVRIHVVGEVSANALAAATRYAAKADKPVYASSSIGEGMKHVQAKGIKDAVIYANNTTLSINEI